jgi:hypothetical protein
MKLYIIIENYINCHISLIWHLVINWCNKAQTKLATVEAIHTLQKSIHLIILLMLLGVALYLVPAGP